MSCNTLDIGSKGGYPAKELSNLAEHHFVLDGIECASLEGFLQALKFEKPHLQLEICKLHGVTAKKSGQDKNGWKLKQQLWWNGSTYDRGGELYQRLLDRAYLAAATQNPGFCQALLDSKDLILTHTIGRSRELETMLTQHELCHRLMKLRYHLMKGHDLNQVKRL